jgi:hypothetical protein
LVIEFGDASDKTVSIAVIPGEPITFGYASSEEEAAVRPYVDRCAEAL